MNTAKQLTNKKYNDRKKQEQIDRTFILQDGEIYKQLINNDKIYITNNGRVFSKSTCTFLTPHLGQNGYFTFKFGTLHRLLGIHFIENPNNYPCIDHIDRNRQNNNLDNLRWVSYQTNSLNRAKGSISVRTDKYNDIIYKYWRVYYYIDDVKKNKTFKCYDDALLFFNETRIA